MVQRVFELWLLGQESCNASSSCLLQALKGVRALNAI